MDDAGDEYQIETWKTVNGRQVSNLGRLWHLVNGCAYYPAVSQCTGYSRCQAEGKLISVHILVALAFLDPKPSATHTVDHIDQDRSNNRVENLRWATKVEQANNRDFRNAKNNTQSKPVEHWNGHEWQLFPSAGELCRHLGVGISTVLHFATNGGRKYKMRWAKVTDESNFSNESWKTIDGIAISDHGRCKHRDGRPFLPKPQTGNGYCFKGMRRIHDLVLRAFVGAPPSPLHTVDHIDRVKSNNHVSNLRWATKKEQIANQGRRASHVDTGRPVEGIHKKTKQQVWFGSVTKAAAAIGTDKSHIGKCANGNRVSAGGYVWRFI